jgi:hypothetical protein
LARSSHRSVIFLRVWVVALYYFDLEERLGSESPMRSVEL